jgi:hypothetical protein
MGGTNRKECAASNDAGTRTYDARDDRPAPNAGQVLR